MTTSRFPHMPAPAEAPASAAAQSPVTAASAAVAVPAVLASDESLDQVQLDAAKLHVYQVALELHTQCSVLVAVVQRVVRDQLYIAFKANRVCAACSLQRSRVDVGSRIVIVISL